MHSTSSTKATIQELLDVHEFERRAHFENDVEALMLNQAETFVAITEGAIHRLSGDDMRRNFEKAFQNATYREFDDVEPPEIRVSDDGTLAWMAVKISVRKSQPDENGAMKERSFVSTSIRTYEKRNGRWLRTGTSGNNVESGRA